METLDDVITYIVNTGENYVVFCKALVEKVTPTHNQGDDVTVSATLTHIQSEQFY